MPVVKDVRCLPGRPRPGSVPGRRKVDWRRGAGVAVAVGALSVVGLAGCGSSGSAAPSTPAPSTQATPVACTQAADLNASLQQLGNVDVIKQGTSALKAAAQTVETQAQALNQTASAQFKPQVDALQSAIDNLKTVLQQLGNPPNLGQAASQLSAAVSQVTTAGQSLINAIEATCPGGLPTVSPTGTASATP